MGRASLEASVRSVDAGVLVLLLAGAAFISGAFPEWTGSS